MSLRLTCSLFVVGIGLLAVGCGNPPHDPTQSEKSYGTPVDVSKAVPVAAVVAQRDFYEGRNVVVEGRIDSVAADGCGLHLSGAEESHVQVELERENEDTCQWKIPAETAGFVVAGGMLETVDDTLRLVPRGLRVTPLRSRQTPQ